MSAAAPAVPRGSLFARLRAVVTPWRVIATLFLVAGGIATVQRFMLGLGRTTNLSDHFPWGLWIGLDFIGIGLAAAGFTIVATVHLLNSHRFEPIVRPAVLTAFIGYMLVVAVLVVDLGRWDRFWHPLVMWNPHSVMFEITWCLILYSTVLAFEFAPVVLERFNIDAPIRVLRAISLPLMLAGVILSTLHQSSFGSLYLIVPGRLHPLWYSPILPVLFFVSCMAAGLSTVIFLALQVTRSGRRSVPMDLLPPLGKVVAVILALYGTLRVQDLLARDAFRADDRGGYATFLFALEFGLGVVAPVLMLLAGRIRTTRGGLYAASILVLAGFAANRMNTVVTGLERWPSRTYFPSWQETAIGLGIATLGFTAFRLLLSFFEIVPARSAREKRGGSTATSPFPMLTPRRGEVMIAAAVPTGLLIAAIALVNFFSQTRTGPAPAPSAPSPPPIARAMATFAMPGEARFDGDGSPGPVTFRHSSHVDASAPECASCHAANRFSLLAGRRSTGEVLHDDAHCGACHDAKKDCEFCHHE